MGKRFRSVLAAFFALSAAHCGIQENQEPPLHPIRIAFPAAGSTYRMSDTVPVILSCDYSAFTSGVTLEFSADSGKTWKLLQSIAPKQGRDSDTAEWTPSVDTPGFLKSGGGVLLRAFDYDRNYFDRTGFFFFRD